MKRISLRMASRRKGQKAEQLVIDVINIGLAAMHKAPEEELKESVLGFVQKYGFLGFMTALPTTADFITYESVYLPKNHFIKAEILSTKDYLSYFYPFDRLDFKKNGIESGWSVTDREDIAITMAISIAIDMGNAPQAVTMGFQKEYAEMYDWIVKEFTDFAFTFMTSFLYYLDYDSKVFIVSRKGNEFCSPQCKNQYNVYKSREKKKGNKSDD